MTLKFLLITLCSLALFTACSSKKLPKGEVERIPQSRADEYYEGYYESPPVK